MSRATAGVGQSATTFDRGVPLIGPTLASTVASGVAITVGASNVTGAWTELIANTGAVDGHFISLRLDNFSTVNTFQPMLMDIGIGAAASEVAIVPSIAMGQNSGVIFTLPVLIPAGSRLAVRVTGANATPPTGGVVRGVVYGSASGSGWRSPSKLVAIGADVANSVGIATGADNVWVEVTSATTQPFQGLFLAIGGNDNAMSNTSISASLGVGPSGAEAAIGLHMLATSTSEFFQNSGALPTHGCFPAGTRLAVRNSNALQQLTVTVLGIPYT